MAATAGQIAEAGRIPGERIATTEVTSSSSTFTTTEIDVASVTAPLVSGRTYLVYFDGAFNTSTTGDIVRGRLREDNTTGSVRQTRDTPAMTSGATVEPLIMQAEYTAVSTGDKTFVATAVRLTGTGTPNLQAASGFPSFLWVDYTRG